jgi:hypothetical protein
MPSLIDHLDLTAPIVRAMFGLLPHCPPPVVLPPAPGLPTGCLHLPAARLGIAGTDGVPSLAWTEAEALGRGLGCDVVLVSDGDPALRYDVLFVEADRIEIVPDLRFWALPGRLPAFVPARGEGPAVVLGRTSLIPVETMPFHDAADRHAGIARAMIGGRLTLAGPGPR